LFSARDGNEKEIEGEEEREERIGNENPTKLLLALRVALREFFLKQQIKKNKRKKRRRKNGKVKPTKLLSVPQRVFFVSSSRKIRRGRRSRRRRGGGKMWDERTHQATLNVENSSTIYFSSCSSI
jgi:hypothetical protein